MTRKIKTYISASARSRTILFNALMTMLGAAEANIGMLQNFIPGNVYAYLFFILAVGNTILRALTTKPLIEK